MQVDIFLVSPWGLVLSVLTGGASNEMVLMGAHSRCFSGEDGRGYKQCFLDACGALSVAWITKFRSPDRSG